MDADLSDDEVKARLQAHLPTGEVWPRTPGTDPDRIHDGLARGVARLRRRARAFLAEAFPPLAFEMLPEWEATLGLPDPCAGPSPTLGQRRAAVAYRLSRRGGQSIPYIVGRLAQLGYVVTITEFRVSRHGGMRFGRRFAGEAWAHAWQVNAPATTIRPFRHGAGTFGERFRTWGNAVLECEARALAPGHTRVLFSYT